MAPCCLSMLSGFIENTSSVLHYYKFRVQIERIGDRSMVPLWSASLSSLCAACSTKEWAKKRRIFFVSFLFGSSPAHRLTGPAGKLPVLQMASSLVIIKMWLWIIKPPSDSLKSNYCAASVNRSPVCSNTGLPSHVPYLACPLVINFW